MSDSQSFLFLTEALNLITNTTLPSVLFGIGITLYFLCAQQFIFHFRNASRDHSATGGRRKLIFFFLCDSLMILMAAIEIAADSRITQLAYINHGGVNGEPGEFLDEDFNSSFHPLQVFLIMPGFVIGTLNPLMQLWRTWVIWASSPFRNFVTFAPLLLVISGLSLDIYLSVQTAPSQITEIVDTTMLSLNFVFTVLVTILLVGRIIFVRRIQTRLLGTANSETGSQFTTVVAMLIESYALDALWSIGGIIAYGLATRGNPIPVFEIFDYSGDQITVIAFLLVSYRVLLGRAWTPATERQLSTLRWNHDAPEDDSSDSASTDRDLSALERPNMVEGMKGSLA